MTAARLSQVSLKLNLYKDSLPSPHDVDKMEGEVVEHPAGTSWSRESVV